MKLHTRKPRKKNQSRFENYWLEFPEISIWGEAGYYYQLQTDDGRQNDGINEKNRTPLLTRDK